MDLLKLFKLNFLKGKTGQPSKQAAYAIDGYEASTFSRDRSRIFHYNNDVDGGNPSAFTRHEILSLSRYAVKNYPLAERILSVTEIFGVGPGLIANAASPDKAFNSLATTAFERWAANAFCSGNNQYNLYEMQKLLARELVLAGEVFIVLIKSPSGYPQLTLVRSENVRKSSDPADDSKDGLYVDDYGKVTAYNIFTGKNCQKVDASNVIHLMRHKDIDQLRGIGSFAASLNSMRDRPDMLTLEKKAIKIHSRIAIAVTKQGGEAVDPLMGGADIRLDGNNGTATGPSNRRLETPFGEAIVLDKDEKIELLASERSTDGFLNFLELLVREVCLNVSLPYEFLVNPDKLNGTAVRFVLSESAAYFRDIQDRILDGAMIRIYGWVIASLINDGKLKAPESGLPWDASFTRPLNITVDSQRVTNAEISLLQNSLLTYEAFYSARGRDWKQELRQKANEEAYLDLLAKETGVNIGRLRSLAAGAPTIAPSEEAQGTEGMSEAEAA